MLTPTVALNIYRHLLERELSDYVVGSAEATGVEPKDGDTDGRSVA